MLSRHVGGLYFRACFFRLKAPFLMPLQIENESVEHNGRQLVLNYNIVAGRIQRFGLFRYIKHTLLQ